MHVPGSHAYCRRQIEPVSERGEDSAHLSNNQHLCHEPWKKIMKQILAESYNLYANFRILMLGFLSFLVSFIMRNSAISAFLSLESLKSKEFSDFKSLETTPHVIKADKPSEISATNPRSEPSTWSSNPSHNML